MLFKNSFACKTYFWEKGLQILSHALKTTRIRIKPRT